ncbi:Phenylacetate-CoA oxygenase, PaaJ subunit [Citrobacter portucalensis]|nr:Phenylacetate-CoA oxygenase, PaaJ subunit [Citrobacter portucalensis]
MQRLTAIAPPEVHTVWGLLSAISDPEVPVLTITDLGMVRSVERCGDGWVIALRRRTPAARPPSIYWVKFAW